jgi:hypothetical protein
MKDRQAFDPLLDQIRVDDIRRYLKTHGWVPKPYAGSGVDLFEGPLDDFGKPIIQLVPQSEAIPDFRLRINELLYALSVIEDRSASRILREIVTKSTESSEGPWYTFDRTVLPIVFEEIKQHQPIEKQPWDRKNLSLALGDPKDKNTPAFVYDSVPWQKAPETKSLIATAVGVLIVLARFFKKDDLLAAIARRILSMWERVCTDFTPNEVKQLAQLAEANDFDGLYLLISDHIPIDDSDLPKPSPTETTNSPVVGDDSN